MKLWKELLIRLGINADRLRIEWISAAEGARFAAVISDFTAQLRELGSLWDGEEDKKKLLKLSLTAAKKAVPYIKLVETSKPLFLSSIEERNGETVNRCEAEKSVLKEIEDKVALSQILLLLEENQCSINEISNLLQLNRSEVSKLLMVGAKMGLVRWKPTGFSRI